MPGNHMIFKAGRVSFLLVCLFLCTGCRNENAVFVAGEKAPVRIEEKAEEENRLSETEEKPAAVSEDQPPVREPVNINTASMEELMSLPWIGEARAAAIIKYREQAGPFETIEEIMNVKGIKTGIFSKINSLICVK